MKKLQTIIIITFLAFSTALMSCKKDETATNKDLLIGKKWYYKTYTYQSIGSDAKSIYNVFNSDDFWNFKADGTHEETWDWGNGTYTLSDDQKIINVKIGTFIYNMNITKINETELEFNYTSTGKGSGNNAFVLSTVPLANDKK